MLGLPTFTFTVVKRHDFDSPYNAKFVYVIFTFSALFKRKFYYAGLYYAGLYYAGLYYAGEQKL